MKNTKAKMNAIVERRLICTALVHENPPAANRNHTLREKVFVYSADKRELTGLLRVIRTKGIMVTVKSLAGDRVQTFNIYQAKTLLRDII